MKQTMFFCVIDKRTHILLKFNKVQSVTIYPIWLAGSRVGKCLKSRLLGFSCVRSRVLVVDFLDVTMSLVDGSYRPYRKDDLIPLYIHQNSNHPPHVKKQMVKMIGRRISDLSSNEQIFDQAAPIYNQAKKLGIP